MLDKNVENRFHTVETAIDDLRAEIRANQQTLLDFMARIAPRQPQLHQLPQSGSGPFFLFVLIPLSFPPLLLLNDGSLLNPLPLPILMVTVQKGRPSSSLAEPTFASHRKHSTQTP